MAIKMFAPAGVAGIVTSNAGPNYVVAADGSISNVNPQDVLALLRAGFLMFTQSSSKCAISSPLPADLVSTVAAVTPSNIALTIAAQPPQARKQQVRVVLGTPGTTNITGGVLTIIGVDQDGNAVTEALSLITAASVTLKTAWAYSKITSATVSGYVALASGTGNTIGLGPSNDFGVQTALGAQDFALVKASKVTKVLGTSNVVADDVAATAVVDAVARTVAPTTAPTAGGLIDYEFTVNYAAPS